MGQGVSKYFQTKFLKEEKRVKLSNSKQELKEFPQRLQFLILILNIIVIILFCYFFALSFKKKRKGTSTSSNTLDAFDSLACFPDLQESWKRWLALIFYELSAVIDLISSLIYLNTLTCNWKKRLTYAKHCSPIYAIIAGLQSIWIQQASLNCADSDSTRVVFSFASASTGIQSVTIIACIALRIFESRLCCVKESCKGRPKGILRVTCAILQIANVIYSLVIWLPKIHSMPFSPSWLKWPAIILFTVWMLVRVLEYVIHIFVHEQELQEQPQPDQQGRRRRQSPRQQKQSQSDQQRRRGRQSPRNLTSRRAESEPNTLASED